MQPYEADPHVHVNAGLSDDSRRWGESGLVCYKVILRRGREESLAGRPERVHWEERPVLWLASRRVGAHRIDERHLLQLQRGGPVMYMSVKDAEPRRIADHARVHVFNDVGSFIVRAKISPAVQPGQVIIYHAWEPYQFEGWRGSQEPVASPWKPLHLAGDYGQLHYRMYYAAPSHGPRATAVEVQPL